MPGNLYKRLARSYETLVQFFSDGTKETQNPREQAMKNTNILVSGAGIAGPTLAYWLRRHGFTVTVVERSSFLRDSGGAVDFRG